MILHRSVLGIISALSFVAHAFGKEGTPMEVSAQIQAEVRGVTLTQIAEHPAVVTPTGVDVDAEGNVWVVASHTHFRPTDYQGPVHDEILVISSDGARRVFYQATDATMDLELGPADWVYLAERDRVLRVRDSDGDGVGDIEENIAVLETQEDYPHNGLSGMCWHPNGELIFSLGENYSTSWTLTGTDQSTVTGTGEGGIFRCRPDGSGLHRIAKGFWNPFGVCVRQDGTMFAAENDPGARPPCRLLHVVDGGDYGYQREYGNAPFHPFVCWNGELRGTLPMLHSVGEAPCGIAPLGNGLIVPTWADHRIDFYPLTSKGASFQTKRITLVTGGDSFRPVCIKQSSETQFYLTDWVYGSYEVHGYGRVWRLDIDPSLADWLGDTNIPSPTPEAVLAQQLRENAREISTTAIFEYARSNDPFLARAALDALSTRIHGLTPEAVQQLSDQDQLNLILAIRKASPSSRPWLDHFLQSDREEVRFESLRWIADEHLVDYRESVEAALMDSGSSYRIFEAALAALNTLSGNPQAGIADTEMLFARVVDQHASPTTRAFALRLMEPNHAKLTEKICHELLALGNDSVTNELAQTLAGNTKLFSQRLLRQMASADSASENTRSNAVAGLKPSDADSKTALIDFAGSPSMAIREEALRSLRFSVLDEVSVERLRAFASQHPESSELYMAVLDPESLKLGRPASAETEAWKERLSALRLPVDREAGRRIFHHHTVATCSKCHRHSGRGMVVGPDLSAVSSAGDPHRLLRSLLQPSRDVDPQYYPWSLITEDGVAFTGIMLRKGGTSGKEFYRDSAGQERTFSKAEIIQRKELSTSMMPDGLIDLMTDREIRDLLAFLDSDEGNVMN